MKNSKWRFSPDQTKDPVGRTSRLLRAVKFLSGFEHGQIGMVGVGFAVITSLCLTVSPGWAADSPSPDSVAPSAATSPYVMAWSAPVGPAWEIFFSRYTADGWTTAAQLTDNGNRNLIPAVVSDHDGALWLFWSSYEDSGFRLYRARVETDDIAGPEEVTELLTNNMAPSAIVDESGTVWLVWSGSDGGEDDIFFSRLENNRWHRPFRVNRADDSPDMQPLIGLDTDGAPWVVWRGFEGGNYRFFYSKWNGRRWNREKALENEHVVLQQIRKHLASLPDTPSEVDEPMKGSIHVKGASIQSFPLFLEPLLPATDADEVK